MYNQVHGGIMPKNINRFIQLLSYAEVRPDLQKINPELCKEIDALSVDDSYPILKVRYAYGDLIIDKDHFQVPDGNGTMVDRHSAECDKTVRDLLNYPSTPMMIPLNGGMEVFLDHPQRPIPISIGNAGWIFALTAVLEPECVVEPLKYWSASAGVRNVLMLPKISHNTNHFRLCKTLGIKVKSPDSVHEHFNIFKAINKVQADPWTFDLLVFTKKWFEDRKSISWRVFREYLFKIVWRNNYYGTIVDLCNMFISEKTPKFKPSPNLLNTLHHVIAISQSKKMGYRMAADDTNLPLAIIQSAYIDTYKLQAYSPEIMIPAFLEDENLIYYSLSYPNKFDFSHVQNKTVSRHDELVKLLDMILYIQENITDQDGTLMGLTKNARFRGIHLDADENNQIISTLELAKGFKSKYKGLEFPVNSSFFCGCLKITN